MQPFNVVMLVWLLNNSLCDHCIGNFYKSADIGAIHIVDKSVFFGSVFYTGFMNIFHYCLSLASTSSRDHGSLIEFWVISSPDVATPPAFAALPGP